MANNKFGMISRQKNEVIGTSPQEISTVPDTSQTPESISGNAGGWKEVLGNPENAQRLIQIFQTVVDGQRTIATIRAETDQKVELIEAEIRKACEATNNRIKEMENEGRIWTDKFEKKREVVRDLMMRLERHPEWPPEVCTKVIELAQHAIQQS